MKRIGTLTKVYPEIPNKTIKKAVYESKEKFKVQTTDKKGMLYPKWLYDLEDVIQGWKDLGWMWSPNGSSFSFSGVSQ